MQAQITENECIRPEHDRAGDLKVHSAKQDGSEASTEPNVPEAAEARPQIQMVQEPRRQDARRQTDYALKKKNGNNREKSAEK